MWLDNAAQLALLLVLASTANGEDPSSSVTVNSRKVINHIAKEFVCFSAKPRSVFEDSLNPISGTTFQMAKQLSPMFMKVYGDSSQLELQMEELGEREDNSGLVQISPQGWRAFDKWAQEAGLVPVFVLDYSADCWKPRHALKVLTVANKLGITNCFWQLGTGNITNAVKYIEDLRAFKAITKAFKYKGIVACDVDSMTVGLDQTRYFNLNVDELADALTVTYDQSVGNSRLKEFVLQREAYLKGPARSHLPIWLDVQSSTNAVSSDKGCNECCLHNGLLYATLLGDAAHNGFNSVFKSLSRQEVQAHSLTYLIALLHKSTIGTKVFAVPQLTEKDVQVYAYCSRVGNGSLTLMAVNHQSEDFEFDIKLTSKQHSTEVQQYVVTVVDGVIQLNSKPFDFDGHLEPCATIRPILVGLQLTVPAHAIAFWVVRNLNLRECVDDYQDLSTKVSRQVTVVESSVDQLLQELIAERVEREEITQLSRQKRSLDDELEVNDVAELEEPNPKRGLKEKGQRSPRQTLNYRRKERTVRLKEKRAERRNLKQQRRPLRERGKRQPRKQRALAKPSHKKTKRSSLAEAVNQPPVFGESYEEQVNRSSFPQGDVHLVISKGSVDDEMLSVEEAPIRRKKYRQKKTARTKSFSDKDLRFEVPEVAYIREQTGIPRPELEVSESIHRQISLNDPEEPTKQPKVLPIDRVKVSSIQETVKAGVPVVERMDGETVDGSFRDDTKGMDEEHSIEEGEDLSSSSSEDSLSLSDHSLEDSPEMGHSMGFSDEGISADSSAAEGHVEEIYRRRRSLSPLEFDLKEAVSMNSTTLQQRFVEIFEKVKESFSCCGDSKENAAQEKLEEDFSDQELHRTKRNALLHPRSWESRERANFLHQQRTSAESRENMISTEALQEVQQIRDELATTGADLGSTTEANESSTLKPKKDGSEPPGVLVLRTMTQLVKSMSTEFNRMLSKWLPKSRKQE